MAPMMPSPLRSKSLDAVPLANSKKRARSADDDGDEAPRVDKKVGTRRITTDRNTQYHHYQPRPLPPLPFRTSPTSQHSLAFSHPNKPRPTSLVSLGIPTPESDDGIKRRSFPFQTPPQSKSSDKSSFSDAFSTFRDTADSDTDMPDSPMDTTAPSLASITPETSPEEYEAPMSRSRFANAVPYTPSSPKASRTSLLSPTKPRSSRFHLLPQPKPVSGQRLPTPTYGHFPPSTRKELDDGSDISPRTASKNVTLRRGLPTLLPPSPISEDELESKLESSSTTADVDSLLSRLKMGSTPTSDGGKKGYGDVQSPSRARLGRRMAVDQGTPVGVDQSQKGGKRTVSMGYREDCEKCRAGVSGHFTHVVKRL